MFDSLDPPEGAIGYWSPEPANVSDGRGSFWALSKSPSNCGKLGRGHVGKKADGREYHVVDSYWSWHELPEFSSSPLAHYGTALGLLGKAMQDGRTSLSTLCKRAHEAGLTIRIDLKDKPN